jgi:hypothetical protein
VDGLHCRKAGFRRSERPDEEGRMVIGLVAVFLFEKQVTQSRNCS